MNAQILAMNDFTREVRILTQEEINSIPINIVCNGFSMVEVITNVLKEFDGADFYGNESELAREIVNELAVRMKIKQGDL